MLLSLLIRVIRFAFSLFDFLLLARVISSWVQPPTDRRFMRQFLRFVYQTTEPVLAPIRQMIPIPGIDLSPIIAFIAIDIIEGGLMDLLRVLVY
ncbi:YggT family protein [Halanaerobaculum tunisiense]